MLVSVAWAVFGSFFSPIKLITGLVTGKSEVVREALKGIAILVAFALGIFTVWYGFHRFFSWIEAKDAQIIQLGKTVESQKTTLDTLRIAVTERDRLLQEERNQREFVRQLEENLRQQEETLDNQQRTQIEKELTRDLGNLRSDKDREDALRSLNSELGRLFRLDQE